MKTKKGDGKNHPPLNLIINFKNMTIRTINDLLKEVEQKIHNKCDGVGQPISFNLKVSLAHDYYWGAILEVLVGDMETGKVITIEQWGKSPEHALNGMLTRLDKPLEEKEGCIEERQTLEQHKQMYTNDKLWKEIIDNAVAKGEGQSTIMIEALKTILEKYKILGDEKDGF